MLVPTVSLAGTLSAGESIKAAGVIERLKEAFGVVDDGDLALMLGTADASILAWRERDVVPHEAVVATCLISGASLTYILTGNGALLSAKPAHMPSPAAMAGVLRYLERDGHVVHARHLATPDARVRSLAYDICRYWHHTANVMRDLTQDFGLEHAAAYEIVFGNGKTDEPTE